MKKLVMIYILQLLLFLFSAAGILGAADTINATDYVQAPKDSAASAKITDYVTGD